jgi:uncharacterized glyoxalase superfamily protein PhnB
MSKAPAKPIPAGHHTVTPSLIIKGCAAAIDFYKKAFGAIEKGRTGMPNGQIMHAELLIGDSMVFMSDEFPDMGGLGPVAGRSSPVSLHLYVEDCDKVFNAAVAAGAKVEMPLMDMFWGDRFGKLVDPFGHSWSVGTHKEDVTQAEMMKRFAEFSKRQAPK